MKAAVVHSPGDVRWEEVPDPEVPEGWVRVEVKAVGVCSSDVPRALHGAAYHYPIILGHEIAGVVREVGPGVEEGFVGKRVAVSPLIPCRRCEWCQKGRYSLCDDYDYLGSRRDGGCAETVIAPSANLVPLPTEISFASGALLEPASVALHAIRGELMAGDDVVVLGAGPVGLFVVQLARLLGAKRIVAVDLYERRLELAERYGALPVRASHDQEGHAGARLAIGERGADLVVVAAGARRAQVNALSVVRKGGRVVFIGLPKGVVRLPTELFVRMVREELELHGAWNSYSAPYPGIEWEMTSAYMAAGRLQAEPLISVRFPMQEAGSAYRRLEANPDSIVKVLLSR